MHFLALINMVSGAEASKVNFENTAELVKDTVAFSFDVVRYAHDKTVEVFPGELKKIYRKFQFDAVEYYNMHVQPIVSSTSDAVAPVYSQSLEALSGLYQMIDAKQQKFLGPIIRRFEAKFPRQKGFVGKSIADKIILVVWIMALWKTVKMAIRMVRGKKGCCQMC
jgi:hypothetical protein